MKAIKVKELNKEFKLKNYNTLFEYLHTLIKRKKLAKKIPVLKNINFEIEKNKFVALIGKNGSGKSTLLKNLAGLSPINSGEIHINGEVKTLIELGVGFNDELSALDNIYTYGVLIGLKRSFIKKQISSIISFADLEGYERTPLKKFSSGMKGRLAFSVLRLKKADIMLIDEVFAIGDQSFEKKSLKYFKDFKKKRGTVLLATHNLYLVKEFCDEVLVLHKGRLKKFKSVEEGINFYLSNSA